jgi:hypothetical protein
LTDKLKGSERVEKTFGYISALTKECRKALTTTFERDHKGLPFDAIDSVLRRDVEAWFTNRDRNIELNHEESKVGKPGELLVTYGGSTKETCFKIHINGSFTVAGASRKSPAYLKSWNLSVDKREFTKK